MASNSVARKSAFGDLNAPQNELRDSHSTAELEAVGSIIREYAASLGVDLDFQDFEAEMASLPGEYSPPRGALLSAWVDGELAGCCALRPSDSADYILACEMKRLYVRPGFRGQHLGRQLTEAILDAARRIGYQHVLLDTMSELEAARALYEDLGFVEIPPYYFNPIPGVHYLMAKI